MKNTVFSTVLLLGGMFMAAVLASAITVKQHDPVKQQKQQEDYYTCPMHTEVVSDEPGKCPICGMELVLASSLGRATMMHMVADTVHMMQGNHMTGDSLHMMQGNHMTGDSLHMMQGSHMTGDSLHMMQGHMHDSSGHMQGPGMMGTMHDE